MRDYINAKLKISEKFLKINNDNCFYSQKRADMSLIRAIIYISSHENEICKLSSLPITCRFTRNILELHESTVIMADWNYYEQKKRKKYVEFSGRQK